jgi:hypothetical protein
MGISRAIPFIVNRFKPMGGVKAPNVITSITNMANQIGSADA